jgi:hypothetical protein
MEQGTSDEAGYYRKIKAKGLIDGIAGRGMIGAKTERFRWRVQKAGCRLC